MKILHTAEFYHPVSGGVQEAVRQISEGLVKLGHDVCVATSKVNGRSIKSYNGVLIKEFDIRGNPIDGYTGDVNEYLDFLKNSDFDIMMNYAAQQWATDLAMESLANIPYKKVIVPCGFSGLYLPQYKPYFEKMKKILLNYDFCIFLSHDYRDIIFAKNYGVKNIIVIPNGASEEEFREKFPSTFREKFLIPNESFLIFHVGSHTGLKGHREAIKIFQKAKIHDATLVISGNESDNNCSKSCHRKEFLFRINPLMRRQNKRLIVKELDREHIINAYHAADLFLFPSNVECSPIVLFESLASKTPFLVSDVGNSKEIVRWSNGGAILPTNIDRNGYSNVHISDSAKILEYLFSNRYLLEKMKLDGFKSWEKNFTWSIIAKKYEDLYLSLLG